MTSTCLKYKNKVPLQIIRQKNISFTYVAIFQRFMHNGKFKEMKASRKLNRGNYEQVSCPQQRAKTESGEQWLTKTKADFRREL